MQVFLELPPGVYYAGMAIAGDGTIIVAGTDNVVRAIDPATGQPKWIRTTGDARPHAPALSADGTVFVACGQAYAAPRADRGLHALDGTTGQRKWQIAITPQSLSEPTIAGDGTVYVTSAGDQVLHAVDPASGTEKWSFPSKNEGIAEVSSPVVGADGTVFFTSGVFLFAVDGVTGAEKWRFRVGNVTAQSTPATGPDGIVIVHVRGQRVWAVHPSDGTLAWQFQLGEEVAGTNPRPTTPAIGPDCTVFIGADDRQLYQAVDLLQACVVTRENGMNTIARA